MRDPQTRITELEIQLTHQARLTEELSAEVARQSRDIERLKAHVKLLIEAAAEDEPGAVLTDQKPPHW